MDLKQIKINGEETTFYITDKGTLFNKKTNNWLKGTVKGGYQVYELRYKNKKYSRFAHRLVLETFNPIENMDNLMVNHKDGNKLNNMLDNLEWVTARENLIHAYNTGLKPLTNSQDQRQKFENDLDNEQWKNYHNTTFYVSNKGRIKNMKTGNLLKGKITNKGYVEWCLSINGTKQSVLAHKLVYELFGKESINDSYIINHIDGNKTNNQIENLEQISQSDNIIKSYYETKTNPKAKTVGKYTLDNQLLEIYPSAHEAARQNEGCISNLIINVCNGKKKTHHGFIWKYE